MTKDEQPLRQDDQQLPTIPNGWCWAKVGEIGDVKLGRQRSPEHHAGPHMRQYLRVANVYEDRIDLSSVLSMNFSPKEFEQYELRPGDILLNEGQSLEWVGRPAMYRGELPGCCFQNTLVRFRPHECVDGRFALLVFRHYLHNRRFQKIARWTVNIAHLGATRFAGVEFPVPPLNEQRRIVAKVEELLPDLDMAVATLKRVRAKLKRYRAAVLKAAIDGKLTADWRARHPDTEPMSALLDRILAERRRRWEDAQRAKYAAAGREPPKGWQAKYPEAAGPDPTFVPRSLERWCIASVDALLREPLRNGHSAKESADGKGIRTLTLSAVTYGDFSETNTKITVADPNTVSDLWLQRDDILVERSNTPELVGISRIFKGSDGFAIFPDLLIRVRVTDQVLPDYVALAMQASPARVYFRLRAKGLSGSMPKIDQETILKLAVALPPLAEQAAIVREVERRLSVVDQAAAQVDANLKRAARLRQSILKRAFEGKLVPQVATDEPASALLDRIRRQRTLPTPVTAVAKPGRRRFPTDVLDAVGRLTAYLIEHAAKPLGRKAKAKLLYFTQVRIGVPIRLTFQRWDHGPFDPAIPAAERKAQGKKWFTVTEQRWAGERTDYQRTDLTARIAAEAEALLGDRKEAFDDLIALFNTLESPEAELLATVYAAWNDLLLDGRPTDETAITAEVYGWHPSKREKFTPEAITTQIAWMRANGYTPTGTGQRTTVPDPKPQPPSSRKKPSR